MSRKIEGSRDGRAAVRRPAMAASTLRAVGLPATDVTVIDLSQTGIRLATETDLTVGDEISIGLTGVGARRAYVAWRRDGQYGCAFEKPLAPDEVAQAFSSASVVRLGAASELATQAPGVTRNDLRQVYGAAPMWHLPTDAILAIVLYFTLFAWAFWHFALMRGH